MKVKLRLVGGKGNIGRNLMQARLLQTILCVFVLMLSCKCHEKKNISNPQEIVSALKAVDFIDKYSEFQVAPITRGANRTYIRFPGGKDFFVTDFNRNDSSKLRISYTSNRIDDFFMRYTLDPTKVEKQYLREAFFVLREFDDCKVYSIKGIDDVILLGTTLPYVGFDLSQNENLYYLLMYCIECRNEPSKRIPSILKTDHITLDQNWSYSVYKREDRDDW